eukprot:1636672-Prymnesium_polylepis.1
MRTCRHRQLRPQAGGGVVAPSQTRSPRSGVSGSAGPHCSHVTCSQLMACGITCQSHASRNEPPSRLARRAPTFSKPTACARRLGAQSSCVHGDHGMTARRMTSAAGDSGCLAASVAADGLPATGEHAPLRRSSTAR